LSGGPPKEAQEKIGEQKEGQGRGREVEGRGKIGWGWKGRGREEGRGREGREMEATRIGGKYASWSLGD
jgi:hypothetical protein